MRSLKKLKMRVEQLKDAALRTENAKKDTSVAKVETPTEPVVEVSPPLAEKVVPKVEVEESTAPLIEIEDPLPSAEITLPAVELVTPLGEVVNKAVESDTGGANFPKTPLFFDFTGPELFRVIEKVKFHNIQSGDYVFEEGDEGESLFIIVTGEAEVLSHTKEGELVRYAKLKEGDFFGEFSFFLKSQRNCSVKAITEVDVLELTKEDLDQITEKHPRVSEVLFDFYKDRVVFRLMAISEVFRCLSDSDKKEVLKHLTLEKYDRGSTIIKEGEKGEIMYLIKEGKVLVWTTDGKDKKKVLTEFEEGAFLWRDSACDQQAAYS